jgi:two-component sensor histidine kinase
MRVALKKTSRNLIILAVLNVVIITSIILILGFQFNRSSTELRKDELKRIVSLGLNSITEYRRQYAAGKTSREDTLKLITDQIRQLTYEDRTQPNYLFMSSYDGTMLVQPYQTGMEGSNQINLTDTEGTYIIKELIRQARKEPGYVTYKYYPPGSDIAYPKISYVVGLPEFDCYIGTGIYSLDISQIKTLYFRQTLLFYVILIAIMLAGGGLVAIPLINAVQYIATYFLKIGDAPGIEYPQIETSGFKKNSDAGMLVQRFADMTNTLAEKNRALTKTVEERDRIMEKALKDKEMLIREMNHRLKNNLQIVISLLNLQKEKSDNSELKISYNESISRMESISLIHQMLYQSDTSTSISGKMYLEQLAHYLIHSFGLKDKLTLSLNITDMDFSIEQAVNLGLLTNEILTNAVKYAVTGNPDCRIEINLRENEGVKTLVINDNGTGIPDKILHSKSRSLGLKLIKTLAAQLNGDLTIENINGTSYILVF